jgi:hypothetical protein
MKFEICRIFKEQGIRFSSLSRVAHTSSDGSEKPIEITVREN